MKSHGFASFFCRTGGIEGSRVGDLRILVWAEGLGGGVLRSSFAVSTNLPDVQKGLKTWQWQDYCQVGIRNPHLSHVR